MCMREPSLSFVMIVMLAMLVRWGEQDLYGGASQGSGEDGLLRFCSSTACMGAGLPHRLDKYVCLRN